jgi:hypothetical protein
MCAPAVTAFTAACASAAAQRWHGPCTQRQTANSLSSRVSPTVQAPCWEPGRARVRSVKAGKCLVQQLHGRPTCKKAGFVESLFSFLAAWAHRGVPPAENRHNHVSLPRATGSGDHRFLLDFLNLEVVPSLPCRQYRTSAGGNRLGQPLLIVRIAGFDRQFWPYGRLACFLWTEFLMGAPTLYSCSELGTNAASLWAFLRRRETAGARQNGVVHSGARS